jgi:hypothetical protein
METLGSDFFFPTLISNKPHSSASSGGEDADAAEHKGWIRIEAHKNDEHAVNQANRS